LAALLLATAPAAAADISELEWLVGAWTTDSRPSAFRWTEERWAPARGGVMLGTSLSGRTDKAFSYEFMRIAADKEGVITFWGSPEGRAPVPFRLVEVSHGEAVFENPSHDFPTRIVYRLTGQGLEATISGPGGANPQRWRYKKIEEPRE
jgi:hypothetical protein